MSHDSSSIDLSTLAVLWPTEEVALQVEVVEPRKLTALEWVLLRVMDVFREAPPPLAEMARELGLEDIRFLRETIPDLVRLRALAPREGDSYTYFRELDFTPEGEQLYRRGKIEGEPAHHRVRCFVDGLTDEDLPEPKETRRELDKPCLKGPDQVRSTLGLDRVRTVLKQFHPDIMRGDTEVRSVEPAWGSRLVWREVRVHFKASREGTLRAVVEDGTAGMQAWLDALDLEAEGLSLASTIGGEWQAAAERGTSNWAFSRWLRQIERVVPADRVAAMAASMVAEARVDVVLHAVWWSAPGLEEALKRAIARGVRVLVVGAPDAGLFAWEAGAGFGWQVATEKPLSGAFIADDRGLILDTVMTQWRGGQVRTEVAGRLLPGAVAGYRTELVEAAWRAGAPLTETSAPITLSTPLHDVDERVTGLMAGPELRLALARLAFGGLLATAVVGLAKSLAPGWERVALLRSLSTAARQRAPASDPAVFEGAWQDAWYELLHACAETVDEHPDLLQRLAAWAPPAIAVEEYVDFAVAWWIQRAPTITEASRRLTVTTKAANNRWAVNRARACPSWRQARDGLLSMVNHPGQLPVQAGLAPDLLGAGEAREWASACLESVPRPQDISDLPAWASEVEPLRALLGRDMEARIADVVRALLTPSTEAEAVFNAVGALLAPVPLAHILVESHPQIERLVEVNAILAQRKKSDATGADWLRWVSMVLAATPPRSEADTQRVAGQLSFPAGKRALESWVRGQRAALPAPGGLNDVLPWLHALEVWAPILARELSEVGMRGLRPLRAALVEAQKLHPPLWEEICASCGRLFISLGWLEPEPPSKPTTPSKKKGKRK